MIEIPLDRSNKIPVYLQIANHIELMIASGAIPKGTRLPSGRDFAQSLNVNRSTVQIAYDVLEDKGFVSQKERSGVYVTAGHSEEKPEAKAHPVKWDMAGETPTPDLIPQELLISAFKEMGQRSDLLLEAPLVGQEQLRKFLVWHAAIRGIPVGWHDMIITSGGRQSLHALLSGLRREGLCRLWVPSLSWLGAARIGAFVGFEVRPYDMDKISDFLHTMGENDVLYLVPSFSNPTGATVDMTLRQEIVAVSKQKGFWILEDDTYGELRYGPNSVPALRAIAESSKTIYMGSVCQVILPGLRVGYAIVPEGTQNIFESEMEMLWGPTSSVSQSLLSSFIASGALEKSLESAIGTISVRMETLCRYVNQLLPEADFIKPDGGIFAWLPTLEISGNSFTAKAKELGLAVRPGEEFFLGMPSHNGVRLSVSSISSGNIPDAVKILKEVFDWFRSR